MKKIKIEYADEKVCEAKETVEIEVKKYRIHYKNKSVELLNIIKPKVIDHFMLNGLVYIDRTLMPWAKKITIRTVNRSEYYELLDTLSILTK